MRHSKAPVSAQVKQRLNTAVKAWHAKLQDLSLNGRLCDVAKDALGLADHEPALHNWAESVASGGSAHLPEVEVLPTGLLGSARGSYAISTGRIYLNQDWLLKSSVQSIVAVLMEELGHHLDGWLNRSDTPGDEGERFAALLLDDQSLTRMEEALAEEDDHSVVWVDGERLEIEQAATGWRIAASGNWSNPANWQPAPPASTDEATIIVDGTYDVTLDVDATVTGLSLGGSSGNQTLLINNRTLTLNGPGLVNKSGTVDQSGGALRGSGELTINGRMKWSGGTQSGFGKTIVTGSFNLTGNGDKRLDGRSLETRGNTLWNGSYILRASNAATWTNTASGIVDVQSDENLQWWTGAQPVFNNAGVFKKTIGAAADSTVIGAIFNNSGTTQVSSGNLTLGGGGNSSGSFDAAAGTVLSFSDGDHIFSSTSSLIGTGIKRFSGGFNTLGFSAPITGTTQITGGTTAFNANTPIENLSQSGGTLSGTGSITAAAGSWSSGNQSGTGKTIVTGSFNLTGNGDKRLDGRSLETRGNTLWNGSYILRASNAATWTNTASGIVDVQSDENLQWWTGAQPVFNNAGVFKKTIGAAADSTVIGAIFNNSGTTQVSSGNLTLGGGGNSSGSFDAAAGTVLSFSDGDHIFSSTSSLIGTGIKRFSGGFSTLGFSALITGTTQITGGTTAFNANTPIENLSQSGGTLSGTGSITAAAGSWSSGTQSGTGKTIVTGSFNLTGNGDKRLDGRSLETRGNTLWNGSYILRASNAATWTNTASGIVDVQSDEDLQWWTGAQPVFNNAGVFKKTIGAAADSTVIGAIFNNSGTTQVSSGNLTLGGGGNSSGSFDAAAGTVLSFSDGDHIFSSISSLIGTGIKRFSGGFNTLGFSAPITGTTQITGGTTAFNANTPIENLSQSGGTLSGTGSITAAAGSWSSGTQSGTGKTIVTGSFNLTGNGDKRLDGRSLETRGNTLWNGSYILRASNAATWTNTASGIVDVQSDENLQWWTGAQPVFNNAGVFKKTIGAAADSTVIGAIFNNSGTTQVSSGNLTLGGGGNSSGSFDAAAGTVLSFSDGDHIFSSTSSLIGTGIKRFSGGFNTLGFSAPITGATQITGGTTAFNANTPIENLSQSGGTLSGTGSITAAAGSWSSGTQSGTGKTIVTGSFNLTGNGDKRLDGRSLETRGNTLWNGSYILRASNAATWTNTASGIVDVQSDEDLQWWTGAQPVFNNAGVFKKTIGAAADSTVIGAIFNNSGTLEAIQGRLSFNGGFVQSAGTTRLNGGAISTNGTLNLQGGRLEGSGTITGNVSLATGAAIAFGLNGSTPVTGYDQLTISGALTLNGTLAITAGNPFTPGLGQRFDVLNYGSVTGGFRDITGLNLASGLALLPVATAQGTSLEVISKLAALGTASQATPLTTSGSVANTTPHNYYQFKVSEASNLTVELSGMDANADLKLISSLGQTLSSSTNPGTSNDVVFAALDPGIYFLDVNQAAAGTTTAYQLSLASTPDGGNSLAGATDLGVLSGNRLINDTVDSQDKNDYFKFRLAEDGRLDLSISGETTGNQADLQLLDSRGNVIRSGSSAISLTLQADTYTVRVFQVQGSPKYQLQANLTPIPDLAGNTLAAARNLSVLNGTQSVSDFIGDIDRDDFYRFELNRTSTVNFGLSGLAASAQLSLLNSQGQVLQTTSNGNGFATPINRELAPGSYYLKVFNSGRVGSNNTSYSLALKADPKITPFQITQVSPDKGSNAGEVTVSISGAQFTPNASVAIVDSSGGVHPASQVNWLNEGQLTASFDLRGRTAGAYDLRVVDGPNTAIRNDLFTVTPFNPGRLEVSVAAPEAMRPWWKGEVSVNYRNAGGTDIPAPLFDLSAAGGLLRTGSTGDFKDTSNQFLGINSQGNAGILRPGESGSQVLRFRPGTDASEVAFTLSSLAENKPLDWDSIRDSTRPDQISPEAWAVIFNNFKAAVGSNTSSYQAALGDSASYLSRLNETTNAVDDLLAFELQQASNNLMGSSQVSSLDAAAPTPGLGLAFGRTFAQSIEGRFQLGAFGRGWSHPWEVLAKEDAEGNVTIQGACGFRLFRKQADGSYQAEPSDQGLLSRDATGFQIRERGGGSIHFRPDGKLSSLVDSSNNSLTASWNGAQLTSLRHSSGAQFTLAYNANGRIQTLTDEQGDVTTYGYDATGQYLESVTSKLGTVRYSYEKTAGLASQHALRSITAPDGSSTTYTYNGQGRLQEVGAGTGAQKVTYSYDSNGGVTLTDAKGNRTQLLLNGNGQVAQSTDALGHVSQFRYDENGNLSRIIAPNNDISSFSYDERGNLLSSVDALGQRLVFSYDPRFDQLETLTDQRGNITTYRYDDKGNLRSITTPDQKAETFNYDTQGNLSLSLNRRGQSITYTYNPAGQLTKKQFSDGSTATYTYVEGRLKTATDSDSSVSYDYYAGTDLLKTVSYNNGRSLTYSYDSANRLKSMVDQAGSGVVYGYDSLGRLERLTNPAGQLVVRYTYDDKTGALSREENGNGTYTTYDYDAAGQLKTLSNVRADGTLNSRFAYTYDALGRRDTVTTLEGKTSYGYDATGQLTSVTLPNGRTITYAYDAAGNRKTVQDSGVTTSYTTNNLNQYSSVGAGTYTYDNDGNLVKKVEGGQEWTYTYDIENRLTQVTAPNGTWRYEYDALGNRVATLLNGERTDYLVDPTGLGNVVGEYRNNTLVANYTHGLGLVSRVSSTGSSYYDSDAIGSTVGLSGANGLYQNTYSYLPFGEDLVKNETIANPFEYVGQWGVMDEGNGLDFMRARYYSPRTGGFTSLDPIGLNSRESNLYRYTANNPVGAIDPQGTTPLAALAGIGAIVGGSAGALGYIISTGIGDLVSNNGRVSQDTTIGGLIGATMSGAAYGAVIGGTGGLELLGGLGSIIGMAGVGGATSALGYGVQAAIDGKGSTSSLLESVAIGALTGPIPWYMPGMAGYYMMGLRSIGPRTLARTLQGVGLRGRSIYDALRITTEAGLAANIWNKVLGKDGQGLLASLITQIRNSLDPNDIVGPAGAGTERWLTAEQTLPYMIRFENQATATAPAVFVTVTHTLDSDLDLSSFELGDFGFRNLTIDVPDGLQAYSTRVDLRSSLGYFVDFDARLDTATRTATWKLDTIDPLTGERPMSLDAGFLPPNNANHDGEGFVNYHIEAKPGLPTGTQIDALASIVFDTNGAIATPLWRNTVDVTGPSSAVAPLPATSSPNFSVSWAGTDSGSGISGYDVYVCTDGGAYSLWQSNTAATSAQFSGVEGKSYRFYSVAVDSVGLREAVPQYADTQTSIPGSQAQLSLSPATLTADEGNSQSSPFRFTVTRTGNTDGTSTATWSVSGKGTTPADAADFTGGRLPAGSVSFSPGQAAQTITIPVAGDTLAELNEEFVVSLAAPQGCTIKPEAANAMAVIRNDDAALAITTSSPGQGEGQSGLSPYSFTVSRSGNTRTTCSVKWSVSGSGSQPAQAADFHSSRFPSGTIAFKAGETSKAITFQIIGDTKPEANESFSVKLSSPTGAGLVGSASSAGGVILNDDLIGTANADTLNGSGVADYIDGRGGADRLSGAAGLDQFVFRFGDSPLGAPDRITDFSIGQDRLVLLSKAGLPQAPPAKMFRATDNSTASNHEALTSALFRDADGRTPGNQPLPASAAVLVVATNAAIAGTYLLINDPNASRNPSDDLLIHLTGFSGTLPPLGSIKPALLFA